jgi:hypothetical protein
MLAEKRGVPESRWDRARAKAQSRKVTQGGRRHRPTPSSLRLCGSARVHRCSGSRQGAKPQSHSGSVGGAVPPQQLCGSAALRELTDARPRAKAPSREVTQGGSKTPSRPIISAALREPSPNAHDRTRAKTRSREVTQGGSETPSPARADRRLCGSARALTDARPRAKALSRKVTQGGSEAPSPARADQQLCASPPRMRTTGLAPRREAAKSLRLGRRHVPPHNLCGSAALREPSPNAHDRTRAKARSREVTQGRSETPSHPIISAALRLCARSPMLRLAPRREAAKSLRVGRRHVPPHQPCGSARALPDGMRDRRAVGRGAPGSGSRQDAKPQSHSERVEDTVPPHQLCASARASPTPCAIVAR